MATYVVKRLYQITLIYLITKCVSPTIDMNLGELQYIADHLNIQECRQLIAALHDKSFDLPLNIDAAVQQIPDEPCIKLLLHWNSKPGEGRGENHEFLSRRLQQLGKLELAKWLSRTVYHQLGQDLNKSILGNPFKEKDTTEEAVTDYEEVFRNSPLKSSSWMALDITLYFIISILLGALLFLISALIWKSCSNCKEKATKEYRNYRSNPKVFGNYILLQDTTLIEDERDGSWNSTV